ncbi:MAG: S-layer homology domain-containing protein [Clostridiales bacterium]|jgi:hypothetical protein|nr:S-layer homology domain-containing protein [Clostridiales bacterium]
MKTRLKTTVLLLLALLILLQLPVAAAAAPVSFPDVKQGDWFAENVIRLTELGIINGKEDGRFHPDDLIKRGEFMKMLMIAGEYLYSATPSRVYTGRKTIGMRSMKRASLRLLKQARIMRRSHIPSYR